MLLVVRMQRGRMPGAFDEQVRLGAKDCLVERAIGQYRHHGAELLLRQDVVGSGAVGTHQNDAHLLRDVEARFRADITRRPADDVLVEVAAGETVSRSFSTSSG